MVNLENLLLLLTVGLFLVVVIMDLFSSVILKNTRLTIISSFLTTDAKVMISIW